jgi:probable F420-dependent oxidoreductase
MRAKEDQMAHKRRFRFGVCPGIAQSRDAWVEQARKAEDLGYSTFLVPDHFVNDLATVPAISVAAEATRTLRVGSYVFDNDFRHPAMVAKEAATLDLLSDGRLELGIGAGWHGPDYEQTGIPFDPPGVRVGRLEEAVTIIKALFGEEPVTFSGKYYTIDGLLGLPRLVQRPHPPILIAGGSKRVLSLAAREADIVGLHLKTYSDGSGGDIASTSVDATLEKLDWIRQAAVDRFDDLEFNVLVPRLAVSDNPAQAAEQLASQANRPGLTAELLLESPNALIGTVDGIVETLQMRRERYFISYIVVTDEDLETFAPVVARLNGK